MKLKIITMLFFALISMGVVNAQKKDKYDTIRLNKSNSYVTVNVYRIGDNDGTTPRFKLKANRTCYVEAFKIGDSIVLVHKVELGERIMFVWSNTHKPVYLTSYSPIKFSIKEKEAFVSKIIEPVAGGVYYLKCSAARGFFEGSPIMEVVTDEVGKKEFKNKTYNEDDEY